MYILLAENTNSGENVLHFPRKFMAFHVGDSAMLVECDECKGKAIIHSRKKLDSKVATLYCTCKNPHCGLTFAMTLSFSHTISPSAKQAQNNIISILRAMPREQQELIKAAI